MRAAFKALMFGMALAAMLSPAKAQTKLTIMVFQGVQNLPLFAAQTKGFFARRGLKAELELTESSKAQRDGLAAGKFQIAQSAIESRSVGVRRRISSERSTPLGAATDLLEQPSRFRLFVEDRLWRWRRRGVQARHQQQGADRTGPRR